MKIDAVKNKHYGDSLKNKKITERDLIICAYFLIYTQIGVIDFLILQQENNTKLF